MARTVITGMGAVTCAGNSVAETWRAVRAGESGFRLQPLGRNGRDGPIGRVDLSRFDADAPASSAVFLDPVGKIAIPAVREALADAGLDRGAIDPARLGCVIGTGAGSEHSHDEAAHAYHARGQSRAHPLTVPRVMISSLASQVSMAFGIKGPVFVTSSACASAAHAIQMAVLLVQSGAADAVLAGGSEACLTDACVTAWRSMHILASDTCRPFSAGRSGLVLADGAAMVVVESLDHALKRGATIQAEILGCASSSDAGNITSPDVDGMARAMAQAIAQAGIAPQQIDAVNAHGTGTELNDRSECLALDAVLGARAREIPVSATKSVTGHALGAAPAIELILSVCTLRDQFVPPTANHLAADPACPVDCVPNAGRAQAVRHLISNSFAFGGLNAAIVLRHASAV